MENRIIAEINAEQIIADLYEQSQSGRLEPNGIQYFHDLRDNLRVLENGFTPDPKTRIMLEQWEYLSEQGRFSRILALEKATPIGERLEILCQIEQSITAIRKIVENTQLQAEKFVPDNRLTTDKATRLFDAFEKKGFLRRLTDGHFEWLYEVAERQNKKALLAYFIREVADILQLKKNGQRNVRPLEDLFNTYNTAKNYYNCGLPTGYKEIGKTLSGFSS